ncbi:Rv2175c family DNA-binding protein [Auritidibacter ignavus]|uniref:Rv2175c family DNA-binding protein n=1 Tax=Auritidibacter ignavus TaxID=678932 RepID=UPI00244D0CA2|nr:Rv2175c family DNA-binding protein [Auritidibacter ignavus]WGH86930.1 Rv2175c family DNA-binding protein [Auritidibacter ignavus]WGH89215.1 Rv2175c family DNA-binding protein [Auritidibacter ignavus]WHS27718.1 Rv2175c family DNA-binding protein [Auritidibacter ignavus]
MTQEAETSDLDHLVGEWMTLPEVAERLGVVVTKVHNMIRDRRLIALRRGENNVRSVPAQFFDDRGLLGSLKGTIIVLSDSGFDDEGIVRWLFTEDESLPGRPIDALRAGQKAEIRRRAQALAW